MDRPTFKESPISLKQAAINHKDFVFKEDAFGLYDPKTEVKHFIKEFNLATTEPFKNWIDGVDLPYKKHSFKKPKGVRKREEKFFTYLEKLNIVSETKKNNHFNSNFFFIEKENKDKLRPIFNYKHMKRSANSQQAKLPSVYQLAELNWKSNLWYAKLDLKQAFFNINLKEESKHCTTIRVNKKSYKFNFLPFGLPQATYICQTFMEAIMAWIKKHHTRFCWGHMDDLLIGHSDIRKLEKTIKELKRKFKVAK